MLTQHIALVSESETVKIDDLTEVAAALQKQVQRDFSDVWTTNAVVGAFTTVEKIPTGYWPIMIVDKVEDGSFGLHHDKNNQPFAMVAAVDGWSMIASHECLEMIVDPWGSRLVSGNAIDGSGARVEYLVEVCDPVQHYDFSYEVNGVAVSDFCTPSYFDPVAAAGVRYSYSGQVLEPRQILEGGYLTWRNPANNTWYQMLMRAGVQHLRVLGKRPAGAMSLRHWVDSLTLSSKLGIARDEAGIEKLEQLGRIKNSHNLASAYNARMMNEFRSAHPKAQSKKASNKAGKNDVIDPIVDKIPRKNRK